MDSPTPHAVFLSYASQDAAAAIRICETLRAAGIVVWFDQNELVGGDAWDRKIRGQIASCTLFLPVISAATQARREGYFRVEWKLAAQRTHAMADGTPFVLPVVIDATRDAEALVPDEFRAVQWTRLPSGETPPTFSERVKNLLAPADSVAGARLVRAQEDRRGQATPLPPNRSRPWLIPAAITLAAAIALTLWQPWKAKTPPASAPSPISLSSSPSRLPEADAKSVAVLAFTNMSADKDTEYFSDGISEEILNALANNPALRLTGRTSSFSFKGKNTPYVEIGRALNVARVIDGSVRKAGNKVRITVQLINAADGNVLWSSDAFDRDMTDIFAVQGEIAKAVAQKLAGGSATPAATVTVAAGAETKSLKAYDAYLRARAGGSRREYLEAVRLDPDYALAWARLSLASIATRITGTNRSEARAVEARTAAENAVNRAPDLPEARLAMALVRLHVDHDHEAAQRELALAEQLRPSDAEVAAARAQLEWVRGRWGAPLAALVLRAAELDPQNPELNISCRILSEMGRFAEADKLAQRWSELSRGGLFSALRRSRNYLAWTGDIGGALALLETVNDHLNLGLPPARGALHAMTGNLGAAIADYNQTSREGRTSGTKGAPIVAIASAARLEARQGNTARAAELYEEGMAAARGFESDFPGLVEGSTYLALMHAGRGEKPEALAAMEQAMQLSMARRDVSQIIGTRRIKAFVLATFAEKEAAIAELRAIHNLGFAFGYLLRRELEWEPLRGEAKFQQLMKEAEARADAQPRPKK